MSMMSEIEKLMQSADASNEYRVVNLGGKSVYIEGIKSVVKLDSQEMIFQMKSCALLVLGNDMKIKYLDKTTCVILGSIKSVSCQ